MPEFQTRAEFKIQNKKQMEGCGVSEKGNQKRQMKEFIPEASDRLTLFS